MCLNLVPKLLVRKIWENKQNLYKACMILILKKNLNDLP